MSPKEQPEVSKAISNKVSSKDRSSESVGPMRYAGIFENDPTFDDFMEKLAKIRQKANEVDREA